MTRIERFGVAGSGFCQQPVAGQPCQIHSDLNRATGFGGGIDVRVWE